MTVDFEMDIENNSEMTLVEYDPFAVSVAFQFLLGQQAKHYSIYCIDSILPKYICAHHKKQYGLQ